MRKLCAGLLSIVVLGGGLNASASATSATTQPARTLLSIDSQPGDFVGGGQKYLVTDFQSTMYMLGRHRSNIEATTKNGSYDWRVYLLNPTGQPVTTGIHPTSADPDKPGVYTMNVTGQGRGCAFSTGVVNVKQLTFNTSGVATHLDLTFIQTCAFSTGKSLTGELAYRATNTTTAPSKPFILKTGQSLTVGKSLSNVDGGASTYRLTVEANGRAVLTKTLQVTQTQRKRSVLWSVGSNSGSGNRLTVRADGRLALLTATGKTVWSVRPSGSAAGNFLSVQSDGNLVLYSPGYRALWSTKTIQPSP